MRVFTQFGSLLVNKKDMMKSHKMMEQEEGEILDGSDEETGEKDDDFEDRVAKLAVEEILKETKISKVRGESSGTWHCNLKKANKRFLKSAIV